MTAGGDPFTNARGFWGNPDVVNTIDVLMEAIEKCGGPSRIARPSRSAILGMISDGWSEEEILSQMKRINAGQLPNFHPSDPTRWALYDPPKLAASKGQTHKRIQADFHEFPEALRWITEQCRSLGLVVTLELKEYSLLSLGVSTVASYFTGNDSLNSVPEATQEPELETGRKRRKFASAQPATDIHVSINTSLLYYMIHVFSTGEPKMLRYKTLDWESMIDFDPKQLQVYGYLQTAPVAISQETGCARCFCLVGDGHLNKLPMYLPPSVLYLRTSNKAPLEHKWRLKFECPPDQAAASSIAIDVALSKIRIISINPLPTEVINSIKAAVQYRFPETMIFVNSSCSKICACGLGSDLLQKWLQSTELLYTPTPTGELPHSWSDIVRHVTEENSCTPWCQQGAKAVGHDASVPLWSAEGMMMTPAVSAATDRAFHKRERVLLLLSQGAVGLAQMDVSPCRVILDGVGSHPLTLYKFFCRIPIHRVGDTVRVFTNSEHIGDTATVVGIEDDLLHLQADTATVQFTCHMADATKVDLLPRIPIPIHADNSFSRVEVETWKDDTFSFVLGPPPATTTSRQRIAPDFAGDNISSLDIFSLNVQQAGADDRIEETSSQPETPLETNTSDIPESSTDEPQPQHTLSMLCAKDEQIWTPVTKIYLQSNGELLTVIGDPTRREYGILIKLKTGPHIVETLSRLRRLAAEVQVPHNLTDIEGELALTLEDLIQGPISQPIVKNDFITVLGPVSERKHAIENINNLWGSSRKQRPGNIVLRVLPAAVSTVLGCKRMIQKNLKLAHFEVSGSGVVHAITTTSDSARKLKSVLEEISKTCLRNACKFYQKKLQQSVTSGISSITIRMSVPAAAKKRLNSSTTVQHRQPEQTAIDLIGDPVASVMAVREWFEQQLESLYQPTLAPIWYQTVTADTGVIIGSTVSGELPEIGENVTLHHCATGIPASLAEGAIGRVIRVTDTSVEVAFNTTTVSVPPPYLQIEQTHNIQLNSARRRWTATVTDVSDKPDLFPKFHEFLFAGLKRWVEAAKTGARDPGRPIFGCLRLELSDSTIVTLLCPNRCTYTADKLPQPIDGPDLQMCWLALRLTEISAVAVNNWILLKLLMVDNLTRQQSSCALSFCKEREAETATMTVSFVSDCQKVIDEGSVISSSAQAFIGLATAGNLVVQFDTKPLLSKLNSAFNNTLDAPPPDMTVSGMQKLSDLADKCDVFLGYTPDDDYISITGTEDDVRVYVEEVSNSFEDGTWEDLIEERIKLDNDNRLHSELIERISKTPMLLQVIGTDLQLQNAFTDINITSVEGDSIISIKGTPSQVDKLKLILDGKQIPSSQSSPQECMACLDERDEYGNTELFTLLCGHRLHADCIKKSHDASTRIGHPARCPLYSECHYNFLTIREYSRIFGMAIDHINTVTSHLAMQSNLRTQTCRNCSDTIAVQSNMTYGICTGCDTLQCLLCKEEAHFWCSCDQVTNDINTSSSVTECGAESDAVKCANCPALIMRDTPENDADDRCRYMICEQCGYEFCWLCLMEANNHKHFDRLNPHSEVQCDPENRKAREIKLTSSKRLDIAPSCTHVRCGSCDVDVGDVGYQCAQCINSYLCESCYSLFGHCPFSRTHNPKALIPLKKQKLLCNKGHEMGLEKQNPKPEESTKKIFLTWLCDRCDASLQSRAKRCVECNYDLCESCAIHSATSVSGIEEDRLHFIIVDGYLYSTLSDVPVEGTSLTTQVTPLPIPDGWEIAPDSCLSNAIAWAHPWSCEFLVVDSGRLLCVKDNNNTSERSSSALVINGHGYSSCVEYSQILIRRPVGALSIPPADMPVPDELVRPVDDLYNEFAVQLMIGKPLIN
eukprot:TRINITY_DN20064_c0_g1_i1.p1 TRINITY_DN20064_c0_g1~~TRINITY_DN20064_c0_g1_i1.p1  ORF type:complete len:1847 (+),score=272.18 TRINITY_DN20064_c0_g1_i1:619-6159(+)